MLLEEIGAKPPQVPDVLVMVAGNIMDDAIAEV
jgi:hypothetical protein